MTTILDMPLREIQTESPLEVCLGPVEVIPLGEGRAFVMGARSIAVFRPRHGMLYAVDNHCPHAHGPLAEGILGGQTIICPLHAYKFNLTTGACLNHPGFQLKTYRVREESGEIYLSLD